MGLRRAFRRVVRRVTPKVKVNIKPPKINIKPPKINIKKPDIVKKLQTTASGGARQLKSNLQSATTTARSNVHGVTTAARTGVHTATDAGRVFLHKTADTVKAAWDQARGKGPKEETGGGGTGATQSAMGSDTSVAEKGSKKMQSGQLAKKKRQKGNTGKGKFKVRVA